MGKAQRFTAIRWAREVPTLLHNDRVDRLAHQLLLLMATYAKNDGTDVFVSTATLAKEAHDSLKAVEDALGRLKSGGLIGRAHTSNGVPGWALNLEYRAEVDAVMEERADRRREVDRERQRRRRELLREKARHAQVDRDSHAGLDRDVTQETTVTRGRVTQEFCVSHAQVDRDTADVTQEFGVSHARVTVTTAGQTGCNSLINSLKDELPEPSPDGSEHATLLAFPAAPKPAPQNGTGYDPDFEAFWKAYGRKGAKRAAANEWTKAIKRADPARIMAKVAPYVRATPDIKWRKDAERWLKGDCWDSVVVTSTANQDPAWLHRDATTGRAVER